MDERDNLVRTSAQPTGALRHSLCSGKSLATLRVKLRVVFFWIDYPTTIIYSSVNMKKEKVFKYTAIFEQDEEKGGYTVTVPSLPGCVSEGETFEEALKNIKEAAELYLEDLKENKERIPSGQEQVVVSPVEVRA